MMKRTVAALAAVLTVAASAVALATVPAVADPPVGVGLLDPTCLVQAVVLGTVVCLVSVNPGGGTTTPTTTTTLPPTT